MNSIPPYDSSTALDQYLELARQHPSMFASVHDPCSPFRIILDRETIGEWQRATSRQLELEGLPSAWAQIGLIAQDRYVLLIRDLVRFPGGELRGYVRLLNASDLAGGSGVVILPEMNGRLILLSQYRHATQSWHLEAPRGFGEAGVEAEENARKELREEIGAQPATLVDLGPLHNNTGMEAVQVTLFFATLRSIGPVHQAEGIFAVEELTPAQVETMIKEATITDAFTISTFARARLRELV